MMSLETIRERVGGKNALSLRIFLLSTPFWILGFALNERASFTTPQTFILVLLLAIIGQIVMGLTLWVGHLISSRRRRDTPLPLTFLIIVWSASALTRITVLTQGFALTGLPNSVPLESRIVVSLLIALVGWGVGSYALDAYDRFRDERAQLLAQILAGEDQLATHRAAVDTMKTTLVNQVGSELRQSRDSSAQSLNALEEALANRSDAAPALKELRTLSDSTWHAVREVLGPRAPAAIPRVGVRELLTLFAGSDPFRVSAFATISIFLYLLVYSRAYDWSIGALIVLGWLGGVVIVALGVNWLLRKTRHLKLSIFLAASLAFIFSSIPLLQVGTFVGATAEFPLSVMSVHAICLMVILSASMPPTVTRARQTVLENLQRHMDSATLEKLHVESQLAIVTEKIASQLHGDVRGNFLASVLNLQRHIDNGDNEAALGTIAKLREALANPLELAPPNVDDAEQLAVFIENWSAILDIELEARTSTIPDEFMAAFHTVVVDAVNNAVRHGSADWVRIGFTVEPDALAVNIRNNGNPRATARVGLGTIHLNQLAPEKWSRFTNDQGITQLVVRLERTNLGAVVTRR